MIYYNRDGIIVRESRLTDVEALSGSLREADIQEIRAVGFKSGARALEYSFKVSVAAYTLEYEGVPVAMFGVVPEKTYLGRTACVWMLGSAGIGKIKKSFVKLSVSVIGNFLSIYPVLFNFVDFRYKKTIKWMGNMGAKFEEPLPRGINGEQFVKFTITTEALWARRLRLRRQV